MIPKLENKLVHESPVIEVVPNLNSKYSAFLMGLKAYNVDEVVLIGPERIIVFVFKTPTTVVERDIAEELGNPLTGEATIMSPFMAKLVTGENPEMVKVMPAKVFVRPNVTDVEK